MTKEELQDLCVDALEMQRCAQKMLRWAHLNEMGAFKLRDAAALLVASAERLEVVSDLVLLELPQYRGRFEPRQLSLKKPVSVSGR